MGTVDYVAPEQITGGELDGRADLYSLGCLLVECLTGEPPFGGPVGHRDLVLAPRGGATGRVPETAGPPVGHRRRRCQGPGEGPGRPAGDVPTTRDRISCGTRTRRRRRDVGGYRLPWSRSRRLLALLAAWFGSTLLDSAEAKPLDKLLRIDPASNAVVQSIDVGDRASSVATGDGYVWVTSMAERDLWSIDPTTGASIVTPVDGTPMDVIVRGDLAVVANGPFEVSLDRIDVKSGKLDRDDPAQRCPRVPSRRWPRATRGSGSPHVATAAATSPG